jgi:hypothetical protein
MRPDAAPDDSGVSYARTGDGETLPVIDITNPAFTVTTTDDELGRLTRQFIDESRRFERTPRIIRRILMRAMLRKSTLGRGLLAASGTYLTGLNTYRLKLGPGNLGAGAVAADHRIAASVAAIATRLRLEDVARLLAESLTPALLATPDRPLLFVNIAGGPAADSWNALILLRRDQRVTLAGRTIGIAVLDLDTSGPAFGAHAIDTLARPGGPLSGVHAGFRHVSYDWRNAGALEGLLTDLDARRAICAVSSEGGLFEYGSDDEIIANLAALRADTPADTVVAGSVTRDDEPARIAQAAGHAATRLRTLEAFEALASAAAWTVDRVIARPFSYNVRLVKAR